MTTNDISNNISNNSNHDGRRQTDRFKDQINDALSICHQQVHLAKTDIDNISQVVSSAGKCLTEDFSQIQEILQQELQALQNTTDKLDNNELNMHQKSYVENLSQKIKTNIFSGITHLQFEDITTQHLQQLSNRIQTIETLSNNLVAVNSHFDEASVDQLIQASDAITSQTHHLDVAENQKNMTAGDIDLF